MSLTTMRRKFKRSEKWIQLGLAGIFIVGCFSFFGTYNYGERAQADDSVVARVNGDEISRIAYERYLQYNQQRAQMTNPGAPVTSEQEIQMRAAAFEMALTDTVRSQVAKQQGVNVSDAEARAQQKKIVDQYLAGKTTGATPEEKKQFEDQVKRSIPLDMIKEQLLGQDLLKQLKDQTKPTEADLMKSFQEYKTRHILIKTDTRSDAEARRRAQDVLAKIQAGVGFEDLARKYSEDPGSKTKGGDLGWVSQKTGFVPEFKAALLSLGKGQVSPLVKTSYGYHIIKVDDTRANLPKDINKPGKKAQYLKDYTDQLAQDKLQVLMTKEQQSAKIEPVDPFVKGYRAEADMLEAMQKGNRPLANKDMADAIAAYEKAAVGRDGGPVIYTKLAALYQQAHQDQKAVSALQMALNTRANPQMAYQLGDLLMKQKRNPEAVIAYQKAADGAYDAPWMRPGLAEKFRELKRPDLAAKEQAKWVQWQKNSAQHPQTVKGPNGESLEVTHTQTSLTPEELKKMKKERSATIPVQQVTK